jgi:hypothetical protein
MVLSQDGGVGIKTKANGVTRAWWVPKAWPRVVVAPWAPPGASLASSGTSSAHPLLFAENMTWQKVWVDLTSGRSLKLKSMQNKGFLFRSIRNK